MKFLLKEFKLTDDGKHVPIQCCHRFATIASKMHIGFRVTSSKLAKVHNKW